MITVTTSIDFRLSVVGSNVGCIGEVMVLCFGVIRRHVLECPLFAVQKNNYTLVA